MSSEKKEIKLRPHHVWGLLDIQENTKNYYLSDEEYIANWREQEGEIKYIDKLILHGRETCTARKPKCDVCVLNKICPSAGKENAA